MLCRDILTMPPLSTSMFFTLLDENYDCGNCLHNFYQYAFIRNRHGIHLYYHKEHLTMTKLTNSRLPSGISYTNKTQYSTYSAVVYGIYQNNVGFKVFTRICHGSMQATYRRAWGSNKGNVIQ